MSSRQRRACSRLDAGFAAVVLAAGCAAGSSEVTTIEGDPPAARAEGPVVLSVEVDGDDAAAGTATQPWATIQHAVDNARPGDTVQVGTGVYSERLVITSGGTESDGPIRLVNAPGGRPVIDGTDVPMPDGRVGLVDLDDVSWFRLEGFEIRNWRTGSGDSVPVGISIQGAGTHVEIVGNDIHDIEANNPSGDRNAHGIAVFGTGADVSISDVLISANTVHDLVLGTSEAVVLNGNVERFTVADNVVRDVDNIAIDIIGFEGTSPDPEADRARDGVISGNTISNVDTARNDEYGDRNAAGIYVDGGLRVRIDGNLVRDSNIGIEIASEARDGATTEIVVRDNVVYRNHLAGIAMGGYDTGRGRTERCVIEFNTLAFNDTDATGSGELWLQYDLVDNTVTDNIIVAGEQGILMTNAYVENDGSIVERNLWFTASSTPRWEWRTESYGSFEDYRAASGNDADSRFVDPLFVDPLGDDFGLAPDSAAVSAGRDGADLGAAARDR